MLELAVALGMQYRRTSESDFAHTSLITVLSPDGEPLYPRAELEEPLQQLLDAVESAVKHNKR